MVNDIVADLLTRLRNAHLRKQKETVVPTTRMVKSIVQILKDENYIENYSIGEKELTIQLKYIAKMPAITHLERISKPGVRVYKNFLEIPRVLNGLGISIFSTSKGVMTGKKAKLEKVGGEYLCNIW
jgi:small subunit ribosomal protein S8